MSSYQVRVATGNGTTERKVVVSSPNQESARRDAESQTGGQSKGVSSAPRK